MESEPVAGFYLIDFYKKSKKFLRPPWRISHRQENPLAYPSIFISVQIHDTGDYSAP